MKPNDPRPLSATPATPYRPVLHGVALLASAFTLPLLFVGGSVTSYGVGLAVPDWPTTFGANMFLYNFWNAPFGVQVEHTHRLYGAAVGLATIVLTVALLVLDRRGWMKGLGVVALVAVIVQGVMGGLRVSQISTGFAVAHGVFGQTFFALTVALCVFTGRAWMTSGPAVADPARLRGWSAALLALIYGQIAVGAWFRHFKALDALWAHVLLAVAVLGVSHALAARVRRNRESGAALLLPSARAAAVAATLQVALGLLALWLMLPLGGNPRTPTLWQAMTRTAHQTNGALLLASAVVLTLRAFGHLTPAALPARLDAGRPGPAPRDRETLEALA
ncbi:MAG: COX15/CtaA family protein [Isosphaeraceae bacterium]